MSRFLKRRKCPSCARRRWLCEGCPSLSAEGRDVKGVPSAASPNHDTCQVDTPTTSWGGARCSFPRESECDIQHPTTPHHYTLTWLMGHGVPQPTGPCHVSICFDLVTCLGSDIPPAILPSGLNLITYFCCVGFVRDIFTLHMACNNHVHYNSPCVL